MNRQRIPMAFALVAALALGGVGCSQHSGNNGGAPTAPGGATTAPIPPTSSTAQPAPIPSPMATSAQPAASGSAGAAGTDFAVLAGSKGYVTQGDAQRDPWLRTHFAQCDSNHDGRVSRAEFAKCHAQQAQGAAGPAQASTSGQP